MTSKPTKPKAKRKRRKSRRPKRGIHVSPIAGECSYRSNWERVYMEHLDASEDVETWSYEKLVIEYVSNVRSGKVRRYFPDFDVTMKDGTRRIVEIKPSRRVHQVKNLKKANAANDWCRAHGALYELVTEKELKALGLLK